MHWIMCNLLLTEEGKVDYHVFTIMKHHVMWRITVLFCRFRRATVVRMLRLTDAFVWEDLPRTDPDTGSLTMAAWIPRFQRILLSIICSGVIFHVTQSSVRLLTSEDRPMLYETWYPFDTTKSPAYELINIAQVTMCTAKYCSSVFYCVEKSKFLQQKRTIWQRVFLLSECFIMSLRNHVFIES
jgi:hypothetical protein